MNRKQFKMFVAIVVIVGIISTIVSFAMLSSDSISPWVKLMILMGNY